jgi:hypothetical protein
VKFRRIKLRRGDAALWTTVNPLLADGEPGLESDTGKVKYGDGVTLWNDLPYPAVPTAEIPPPESIALVYDLDGRLVEVTGATTSKALSYAPDGKLVTVADGEQGLTKTLVYDGDVLQEVVVTPSP